LTELRNEQHNPLLGLGSLQELNNSTPFSRNVRTPGFMSSKLLGQCIEFYLASIHPLQPILQQQHVHEIFMAMDVSAEACSMVLTVCAYTMMQTDTEIPFCLFERSEAVRTGRALLEESCRLQGVYDYRQNPTHRSTALADNACWRKRTPVR
jgi:hypothetical protein